METAVPHKNLPTGSAARDIVFKCQHCAKPLVVDRAAAGVTLDCQQCGKPIVVPPARSETDKGPELTAVEDAQLADVQRRLKENASQRTEITSYINQLRIQFHRGQLRLQTLEETQKQLNEEMAAIRPSPQI
jgi:ribosomal protein L37AE/L43A